MSPLAPTGSDRILRFAQELQRASDFQQLCEVCREEAAATVGISNAWLYVFDDESMERLRLVAIGGSQSALAWEKTPVLPVRGDRMIEEMVATRAPMVIQDARADPRPDPRQVESFRIRTLINVPVWLIDRPFGALSMGTFGEEPLLSVSEAQLEHVMAMANLLSVAMARIRWQEEKRLLAEQRAETERRLGQIRRLETLGLMAGGVAHDFNNLLHVILSGAQSVAEGPLDPARRADLELLVEAAERGRALIQQLRAIGGRQELSLAPLDLGALVRRTAEMLAPVLPPALQVQLSLREPLPPVRADQAQIGQVLMNLFLNARDAMPAGGRLTASTELVEADAAFLRDNPWAAPGRYLRCSVQDEGPGIPPEVRARIFEPFFTTKGEQGTGLGLAVSYGIARQHGGMLQCSGSSGAGSTFTLELPVAEARS